MDVRDKSSFWIDYSRPGEPPRYNAPNLDADEGTSDVGEDAHLAPPDENRDSTPPPTETPAAAPTAAPTATPVAAPTETAAPVPVPAPPPSTVLPEPDLPKTPR
jgi:hypothetical protein